MKQPNIRLSLGGIPVEQITNQILNNCTALLVVLKLPGNYDSEHLRSQLKDKSLLPLKYRNVLFVFVTKQPLSQREVFHFNETWGVLKEKDLLGSDNFTRFSQLFEKLVSNRRQ